jgi:hypothetical protein
LNRILGLAKFLTGFVAAEIPCQPISSETGKVERTMPESTYRNISPIIEDIVPSMTHRGGSIANDDSLLEEVSKGALD